MRSRLLDRPALEKVIARYNLADLVATLEGTPYADDLTVALAGRGENTRDDTLVALIDFALSRHLSRTGQTILEFYDGRARDLVGILLGRRDLQNLLSALRGHAAGASAEEVSRLDWQGAE